MRNLRCLMVTSVATLMFVAFVRVGGASAQLVPPQNCNEFEMIDQSNYNGAVHNTPMVLLACENGLFMDYGSASGSHSGRSYLASSFNAADNTLAGTVVEYEDGTGCGPTSFTVNGELVDGQFLFLSGFRPVRIPINQVHSCMVTGEFEQVDRQFALASPPPPPPPAPSGNVSAGTGSTSSSSGGGSSNCVNVPGALVGGALGGFAGNQFGSGSGKTAATAGGAALGAVIGSRAGCN